MGGMSEARVQALILHFAWRRSEELLQPFAGFCIVGVKECLLFLQQGRCETPRPPRVELDLLKPSEAVIAFPAKPRRIRDGWEIIAH